MCDDYATMTMIMIMCLVLPFCHDPVATISGMMQGPTDDMVSCGLRCGRAHVCGYIPPEAGVLVLDGGSNKGARACDNCKPRKTIDLFRSVHLGACIVLRCAPNFSKGRNA